MEKVIIVVAGNYDLLGKGTTAACAIGDVREAVLSVVGGLIQAGDMRVATGQEVTDAMATGTAF